MVRPMNCSVVIPAYNEEKELGAVINETITLGYVPIVVNDGSGDNTGVIAQQAGAIVLEHIINMGKGAAARTGCDWAAMKGANIIVLMDADGQHKPKDIKRMLKEIQYADVVFGYRSLNKDMPLVMRVGNWFINTTSKVINGIDVRDTQSGFRAMKADTYKRIRWTSNDYGMESEMIGAIAKKKISYKQIPISTIYKDSFKGTTVIDGIRIVLRLIKWRLL
jgi:glycosyltransferase involved in cell wall biosynthesis